MYFLWIILGIIAMLAVAVLSISYICFRLAFYVSRKHPTVDDVLDLPNGEIYAPHLDFMESCTKQVRHAL